MISKAGKILRIFLYAIITLLYIYAIFAAIGNLVGMQGITASLGTTVSIAGYFWLCLDILIPTIAAAVAFSFSRKSLKNRYLILLAGLAIVSIAHLEIMHFVPQGLYFNDLHHHMH